jgi:hypothetical protein
MEAGDSKSVEQAMKYLQEVEKELPDGDFVDFLNVIEDFKNNRCLLLPRLSRHHPIMLTISCY